MSVTGGPQLELKCYEQCHNVPLQQTRGGTSAGLVYLLVVAAISAQQAPATGNAHGVKAQARRRKLHAIHRGKCLLPRVSSSRWVQPSLPAASAIRGS